MNNRKIYISDLDGTLLKSDGTLSEYSRGALTELLQAGVHFTVASARAWGEIVPVLGDLPLSLPVIAVNGAYLTDYKTGKHLVINHLDNDFAQTIYQHILAHELLPFIVTHNGVEGRSWPTSRCSGITTRCMCTRTSGFAGPRI
ncbi:MAG: HAD family hydrolase [Planctomycetota bacterium]